MIIKDMSLNYLYISHPIFVNLYNKVCGFTGTIGNQKEKKIFKQEYNLKTVKIPRNKPNQRVEFPMILCDTIEDRNKCIVFEILKFHKQGNPVLAIFQDLREIEIVAKLIYSFGIQYINFFDGKDDIVLPDKIAGLKGAISLGTNYCGRGTNILIYDKPLHVIISFYSSNERVMNQARGRTARQGQKGTVRIICLKEQFFYPKIVYDDEMKNIINEFGIKNEIQEDYMSFFQELKPWIFANDIDKQNLDSNDIIKMREARINVNRIVAYNFRFPLKMKVETFLKIQSQRIFSIFNCPDCKFTWKLFQKYIREMILEAWSIKVKEIDETFFNKKENEEYKKEIEDLNDLHLSISSLEYQEKREKLNFKFSENIKEYKKVLKDSEEELISQINKYIPNDIDGIVPTFMNIFNIVVNQYENDILQSFKKVQNAYIHHNKNEYVSCQIGFKPYSLLTESGARITYKNFKKTNYIKDPEMKYLKKTPKNRICLLSITEKLDDLFNLIFQKINEVVGSKTFLKFFMRRTLCGCEFGICLNFPLYNQGFNDPYCIIDRDPLLVFTISVKSIIPILAGVLIILLVYAASMAKDIGEWFGCFSAKFTKELAVKAVGIFVSTFAEELFHFGLDKIIELLKTTLTKQLNNLRSINSDQANNAADIISKLKSLFASKTGRKINEKFSNFLGDKIKVTLNWQKLLKKCLDPERIMKISFYIILCIATFIMNFSCKKNAIAQAQNDSKEFDNSFKENILSNKEKKNKRKMKATIKSISDREKQKTKNRKSIKDEDIEEKYFEEEEYEEELIVISNEEKKEIENNNAKYMLKLIDEMMDTYFYKFHSFKPADIIKKLSDFIDNKEIISNRFSIISSVFQKGHLKSDLLRFHYKSSNNKQFMQQVRIYATNKFPSILNIVGYSINKKNKNLYFENKCITSLAKLIDSRSKKLTRTKKIIIAYGIASALKYLHCHQIAYLGMNPSNILLDSSLFPYISEFQHSKLIIDSKDKYCYKYDIFNYGLIIFNLITGADHFTGYDPKYIMYFYTNDAKIFNSYPLSTDWSNLIKNCWNSLNNDDKFSFFEICNSLESISHNDKKINIEKFKQYKKIFKNYVFEKEENYKITNEKEEDYEIKDKKEENHTNENKKDATIIREITDKREIRVHIDDECFIGFDTIIQDF